VPSRRDLPRWLGLCFAVLFLLHAANYLYFFVDDEAIPYVYAQNLLNGKGLRYNSFEGPAEGYSDFLQVWIDVIVLGVVRLIGWPTISVFAIGTLISLCAGALVVIRTFQTLRKIPGVEDSGLWTSALFLCLAGPLAVWSCSALETALFALLITELMYRLVSYALGEPLGWTAGALAIAATLTRIDGVVFVAALLGSAMLLADSPRRRALFRHAAVPVAAVLVVYHGWRWYYFGDLLPAPVAAKVLYKVQAHGQLVTKEPARNYLAAFAADYGLIPAVVAFIACLAAARRRVEWLVLTSVVPLLVYLAVVGDWMFGRRFFVPALPLLAVALSVPVSGLTRRSRVLGWTAAVVGAAWFGWTAVGFWRTYQAQEQHPSWLAQPTFTPRPDTGRYGPVVKELRSWVRPGDRIVSNQAGFIPFMLDADNLDTLGICSPFVAALPTTDVFFTEVGRYSPLTNKPVFRASEAYLLYHEPAFIIEPTALVRPANQNHVPEEVLDGAYRLLFIDATRQSVVYQRTAKDVQAFRQDPHKFLENVAHVSRVRRAAVNGLSIPGGEVKDVLPWLRDGGRRFTVTPGYRIDVEFSAEDVPVHEFFAATVVGSRPLELEVTLRSCAGTPVFRDRIDVAEERPQTILRPLPAPAGACSLTFEVAVPDGRPVNLEIWDVRVQGQPPPLARYVSALKFGAR
jgi:hypothetical protein